MDESEFVDWLKHLFPFSRGLGIGDDASFTAAGGISQLITTDLLVESVHFRRQDFRPEELAAKSLAVNLSDIAAMGGTPGYYYLCLGIPESFARHELFRFLRRLKKENAVWGVELAGGDISRSPLLTIAITMVGHADHPVTREGACAGDWIGITGPTGHSALGLHCLRERIHAPVWINRHKRPIPHIEQGKILATCATSMIDISDGLLKDMKRILRASRCGAYLTVDRLPLSRAFKNLCRSQSLDPYRLALSGGEDYVLLFTCPEKHRRTIRETGLKTFEIGRIVADGALQAIHQGVEIHVDSEGYDHFDPWTG